MCWRHVDTQLQIREIAETVGKAVECTVCGSQVPPSAAPFQGSQPLRMYLLYLDGSGSVRNPTERHFVLAGVSEFERQIYHLISRTDQFVASFGLGAVHDVELHASVMANGRESPWKGMVRQGRMAAIEASLDLLKNAHWSVNAFAVVVDKRAASLNDPVEHASGTD